jgi:hypothetical protein
MLQILKDISGNRMPSVAELLKQASQAPQTAANSPSANSNSKQVGNVRDAGSPSPSKGSDSDQKKKPNVPTLVDIESSQGGPNKEPEQAPAESKGQGSPSLGLLTTMLPGMSKGSDTCPVSEKVEEAVVEQQDLLAEFDKIADELNRVLANLEGSTIVKRLKAQSRLQDKIAGRLGNQLELAFDALDKGVKTSPELSAEVARSSQDVSTIMDDMHGYFERRRFMQFKNVLDEMRQQDVIDGLRRLSDDLTKESGLSIAQCEFWSDTLDRWADDLVEPAAGGT